MQCEKLSEGQRHGVVNVARALASRVVMAKRVGQRCGDQDGCTPGWTRLCKYCSSHTCAPVTMQYIVPVNGYDGLRLGR